MAEKKEEQKAKETGLAKVPNEEERELVAVSDEEHAKLLAENKGTKLDFSTDPASRISKYLETTISVYNLPRVDLMSVDAVVERINKYFGIMADMGVKPTVTGLGMALGVDRRRLWELKTGNLGTVFGIYRKVPEEVRDIIIKTYDFMEVMWEHYMLNGEINPVSGIFLGKNHFGYQDRMDYVVTPNAPEEEYNAEEIKKRYMLEDKDK